MKKMLVFMMVLGMASLAQATIMDIVPAGPGSNGHLGTSTDPLDISETLPLMIVLNHNPYPDPGFPSYDGYLLSSFDLDLHITGPGTLDTANHLKDGSILLGVDDGVNPFTWSDADGTVGGSNIAKGFTKISGVSLGGVPGPAVIIFDLLFHCDGLGPVQLDLTLNGLSEYSPFKTQAGKPFPGGFLQMTEADLGDLVIHQVPEPMTIGLLALGGLGLLRRRRA